MESVPAHRFAAIEMSHARAFRYILGAALSGLFAAGCLDQNPGGAQQQATALRAESSSPGHPECRDENLLLILDEDALAPGRDPNRFSERDLGCSRKKVGNRSTVDWFSRHIGLEMTLPSGDVGDEGWFAPTQVRIGWKSAGPEQGDGLRNYMEAGPGLGSPDSRGNAETLLENVPGLAPLRATGLARLEGRSVCAITLDGEVTMKYNPLSGDIRGKSLGKIAFQVLSTGGPSRRWDNGGQQGYQSRDSDGGKGGGSSGGSNEIRGGGSREQCDKDDDDRNKGGRGDDHHGGGSQNETIECCPGCGGSLPSVRIRILDADAVCADPLSLFVDAPLPTSQCLPKDVERPSCAVQRELLNEAWNTFDTTVWHGDGDQITGSGLLFAREGAFSTAADWIPGCPLSLDSNTTIKFTNRIQLLAPTANNFVESGALFMVNADNDGSFSNFAFLNVGFTGQPGKVFVETFGASGGQDFDQFEESSIASAGSISFAVDMWISKDSYQIAVGNEMIDTVLIASPLASIGLMEVGVQQNMGGLRGLIDQTTVSVLCKTEKERVQRCRRHSERSFCVRKGRYCKRSSSSSSAAASTADPEIMPAASTVGHIRGRNNLIRMAREKVRHLAHPPKGLLYLSKLKEIPDPSQY
jgi:hypothetical protein